MFGSIFYNLWAALLGFSIYSFSTLSDSTIPLHSLIGSFVVAVISFLIMFAIRFLLWFIINTPENEISGRLNEENEKSSDLSGNSQGEMTSTEEKTSTVEFSDENSKEIARVVQTMLDQDKR